MDQIGSKWIEMDQDFFKVYELTCATTSLAPQLIGVLIGRVTSGVVIDKMSNDGPTSGERNGEVTRFNWILYSAPRGGAL